MVAALVPQRVDRAEMMLFVLLLQRALPDRCLVFMQGGGHLGTTEGGQLREEAAYLRSGVWPVPLRHLGG